MYWARIESWIDGHFANKPHGVLRICATSTTYTTFLYRSRRSGWLTGISAASIELHHIQSRLLIYQRRFIQTYDVSLTAWCNECASLPDITVLSGLGGFLYFRWLRSYLRQLCGHIIRLWVLALDGHTYFSYSAKVLPVLGRLMIHTYIGLFFDLLPSWGIC